MFEEPNQNGLLPLLIIILVTAYGVFLDFTRSGYKSLKIPLSNGVDMYYNKTKLITDEKKTKKETVVDKFKLVILSFFTSCPCPSSKLPKLHVVLRWQ